jgi:hypothetical protein
MGRSSVVASRAWREALAEVRLDSPVRVVTGIISPLASGLVVWWITGSPAWGGVVSASILLLVGLAVFATKMFTVPLAMANEADAKLAEIMSKQAAVPPHHPDGIYQHGYKVAMVAGANERIGDGVIEFAKLVGGGDFNPDAQFSYRNFVLEMARQGVVMKTTMAGQINVMHYNPVCRIISRS